MTYSKSKRAIKRVEPYLTQMVASESEIRFPAEEPSDFAYRLREGINAAKEFAADARGELVDPYYKYANLQAKFIIRVKGSHVVCEPRDVVPVAKLRHSLGQVTIPDVNDTLAVIGAAIAHKAPTMVFTAASAHSVNPNAILRWASENGYYLIVSSNHVTLTKENPGDLAWKG